MALSTELRGKANDRDCAKALQRNQGSYKSKDSQLVCGGQTTPAERLSQGWPPCSGCVTRGPTRTFCTTDRTKASFSSALGYRFHAENVSHAEWKGREERY